MRFGTWLALPNPELAAVPEKAGCFQVRVASGLLDYPRGKSAMVAYGAAESAAAACREFLQSPVYARAQAYGALLIRFAEPEPHGGAPAQQIDRLRERFRAQFGAPPLAEEVAAPAVASDGGSDGGEAGGQRSD